MCLIRRGLACALTAALAAATPAQAQLNRTFAAELEGGFEYAACGMRAAGPPEATGQLRLTGIPAGATVLHASLNWVTLGDADPGPDLRFGLQGSALASLTGESIGVDDTPCWPEHDRAWAFRVDVCDVVAANGNAVYEAAIADSGNRSAEPSVEGVTLLVVWELPGSPARDIVIYEGAVTIDSAGGWEQVMDGFDAADPVDFAELTLVLADTQSGPDPAGRAFANDVVISDVFDSDDAAACVAPSGLYYDTDPHDVSAIVGPGDTSLRARVAHSGDCFTWTAAVLEVSTPTVWPPSATCAPPDCDGLAAAAADVVACEGEMTVLDASGSTPCGGEGLVYRWLDGAVELCPPSSDPTCPWVAAEGADLVVEVSCDMSATCTDSARPTVSVELPPLFADFEADDRTPCGDGVLLTWDDAIFRGPGGLGTYSVFRSELSCADALLQPPLATGLSANQYRDFGTMPGRAYDYVVLAENAEPAVACPLQGPLGGAAATACANVLVSDRPIDPNPPEGVFATLFARHDAGRLTLHWGTARDLEPDEAFWILQAESDALGPWLPATLVDPLGREHVETELSSPLQFFDLRVIDDCGRLSEDEFPATGR